MSGRVCLSNITKDYRIGLKQGLRNKYYDEDWEPAQHEASRINNKVREAMYRHISGHALNRKDFPEATAIFDRQCFRRIGDLFISGRFFAAKRRLADVLSKFNLGYGELIPFVIYQEDLKTPIDEEFYYINFGARKNTFIPTESKNVGLIASNKDTGIEIWKINEWAENGDVAVSLGALVGADLWIEEKVDTTLFMSEALAVALSDAKLKPDFELTECRVMENVR